MSLAGKTALIVGGVGPIGRALARGMLQAGADVIVNSRSEQKLANLHKDLGRPGRLHCVQGTMMPSGVDRTVEKVLDIAMPQHVVAHSGVAWWGEMGSEDETNILNLPKAGQSILDMERKVFSDNTGLLVEMHFSVAQLLIPKLRQIPGSSYTFVTGTSAMMQRHLSALTRINTHHVSGLASALRAENKVKADLFMSELRVGNLPMRDLPSVAKDPNQLPLSAELGLICGGLAQAAERWEGPQAGGDLYIVDDFDALKAMRTRFPCAELPGTPIPALWYWEGASAHAAKPTMPTDQD